MTDKSLEQTYFKLLNDYLFGGDDETALYQAYEFSRQCIQKKIGLEEITAVHTDVLGKLTHKVPFQEIPLIISKSSVFFLEFIMNFSLMYKEYFELWQATGEQLHEAIKQTGDALVACLSVEETLRVISSIMQRTTGTDSIIIYQLENNKLIPKRTDNIITKTIPKETNLDNTLAGASIKEGKIKIVITKQDLEKFPLPKIKNNKKPSSAMAIPLIGKNKIIGAIECYYDMPYALSELDNETLLDMASRSARSIENVSLLSRCKARKDLITPEEAIQNVKIARRIILGEGKKGYCLKNKKTCNGLQDLIQDLDSITGETELNWLIQWIEYMGDFELATRIKANPQNFKQLIKNRYEYLKRFII